MYRIPITFLDGAMGTMLQNAGLKLGERPETLNILHADIVENVHKQYIEAGAQIVLANTFCANAHKLEGTGFTVYEVVEAGVRIAKKAAGSTGCKVALDMGPIGELLKPLGTLDFDEAYGLFKQMVDAGVKAGADLVFIETFSDLNEVRAAVLAAKENSNLPVYVCMTFEESGRTFLGCCAESFAMTMNGLGVQAIGMNCSLGPVEAMPILKKMRPYTNLPLILKANAGLPDPSTGEYHTTAGEFAQSCLPMEEIGVAFVGGCCGTTPEFISALKNRFQNKTAEWTEKIRTGICSSGMFCQFGRNIYVIGERINPTGKKRFQQALREADMQYICAQAVEQFEAGAQILDINVGLPGIDEVEMMKRVVTAVSGTVMLPLQIDSSNPDAIEAGLRAAPGKCLVNSVNASDESLEKILPIARKYGAAVVGLTLDEHGLPDTVEQRVSFARKICEYAQRYGIDNEEIAIDCLTLTVSAQQDQAEKTLRALKRVRDELGVQTVLGVSNISFGLPERVWVTQAFLTQAIAAGLTLPIINPNQKEIISAVDACRVLNGEDQSSAQYIEKHAQQQTVNKKESYAEKGQLTIGQAIAKGLAAEAAQITDSMLKEMAPLDIVEKYLIPALDDVGVRYEKHEIFLPQLMNAAAASGAAFDVIKSSMRTNHSEEEVKGPIVLATVEGDIHDIGKNIVKTVLENYGYKVIDLGRDVAAQAIVDAVVQYDAKIVGLSALMTTTVPSMENTIKRLREKQLMVPVIVGGAVLTEEYAAQIGADYYAKDAKQSADIARRILG